ncbi:MAG: radical SAM protein [Muribaculaceae bacterium]|nr:radical SAM protein [Muribaculaceae bacterium]
MNIYSVLKLVSRIKSPRIKVFGLWAMHVFRRRYIGVFLDPVMACNLRCRMCYLSAPGYKVVDSPEKALMTPETLQYVADTFFPRALKLQIGCSTEPTLFRGLDELIRIAKSKGVPYISLTTNGQLLTADSLRRMIDAGLNEITLSVHGFDKEIYEDLMRGANFERFLGLMASLREIKKEHPEFKVRVNYVINADNILSLKKMYDVFGGLRPDVLQLRPIQKLGESSYDNFSHEEIKLHYDDVIAPIVERCRQESTVCLCPSKKNLESFDAEYDPMVDYLEELTYYYVSPSGVNKPEFRWKEDSFSSYHKRRSTASKIWKSIWKWNHKAASKHSSRKLNYDVN